MTFGICIGVSHLLSLPEGEKLSNGLKMYKVVVPDESEICVTSNSKMFWPLFQNEFFLCLVE